MIPPPRRKDAKGGGSTELLTMTSTVILRPLRPSPLCGRYSELRFWETLSRRAPIC